jgi:hypothetical protein
METEYSKGYDLQGGQGSYNETLLSLSAHLEQGQLIVCNACPRTMFIKGQHIAGLFSSPQESS